MPTYKDIEPILTKLDAELAYNDNDDMSDLEWCNGFAVGIQTTIDTIQEAPRIDFERHIGHWILKQRIDEDGDEWRWYECSECHEKLTEAKSFCCGCGATMIGPTVIGGTSV